MSIEPAYAAVASASAALAALATITALTALAWAACLRLELSAAVERLQRCEARLSVLESRRSGHDHGG